MFLRIFYKHFGKPRKYNLHKTFNRKPLNIGYSCNPNFKNIKQNRNSRILLERQNKKKNPHLATSQPCNCKIKTECSLNNKVCNISAVVYLAEVEYFDGKTGNLKPKKLLFKSIRQHKQRIASFIYRLQNV